MYLVKAPTGQTDTGPMYPLRPNIPMSLEWSAAVRAEVSLDVTPYLSGDVRSNSTAFELKPGLGIKKGAPDRGGPGRFCSHSAGLETRRNLPRIQALHD